MSYLVSIIIPVFNRAHLIKETLQSLQEQTYRKWECIVVDDGSSDYTGEVVNAYVADDNRICYYERPASMLKGPSSCRNFGLKKAEGQFVIFLDSDDLLAPNCLFDRLQFAKLYPDYSLWIFKTRTFEREVNDGKIFNLATVDDADVNYLKLFYAGLYPFCVSGPFWEIGALRSLGGFDEHLTVLEDPDLHIRAFVKKIKSKTYSGPNCDNFYRIDKTKVPEKSRIHNKALLFFIKYFKSYKNDIRKFSLQFYIKEVLLNGNVASASKYYVTYNRFAILNMKQILLVPILIIAKLFKLEKRKGFGFYKFSRYILK